MSEQLFTIPVNDAFDEKCECPLCSLYKKLEADAIEFTMGPSYMEDDNREVTDRLGFCKRHVSMLYANKNRLGLALMLNTHMNKVSKELSEAARKGTPKAGLLAPKKDKPPVVEYIERLNSSCFVCDRINLNFPRYIDTIFYLWKKDESFREKLKGCSGFCVAHYGVLYDEGRKKLGQKAYDEFIEALNKVFFENYDRVNSDVSWFIDKYDYRNKDADWKNSKDAIPRAIIKTDSEIL